MSFCTSSLEAERRSKQSNGMHATTVTLRTLIDVLCVDVMHESQLASLARGGADVLEGVRIARGQG